MAACEVIKTLLSSRGIKNIKKVQVKEKADDFNLGSYGTGIVEFNDDNEDFKIFMKICKKGSFVDKVRTHLLTYEKETLFYDEILPLFKKFQADSSSPCSSLSPPISSLFFNFFGTVKVEEDTYLILEKMEEDDYIVKVRDTFHTEEEVKASLRCLGSFHAVSFCLTHLHNIDFPTTYPLLGEKLFQQDCLEEVVSFYEGSYKGNLKLIKTLLSEIRKGNPLVVERFSSYVEDIDDYDVLVERLQLLSPHVMLMCEKLCVTSSGTYDVICHGDFHMGNIAFNKHDPQHLKMFDFQAVRFASGLLDVHQYLGQITSPNTREQHLQGFLESYHSGFSQMCNDVGLDKQLSNMFSFQFVQEEYKRTSPWGFFFGFAFIMRRFISSEVWSTLQQDQGEESPGDVVRILTDLEIWHVFEVYLDLIREAKTEGVLDIMENLTKIIRN